MAIDRINFGDAIESGEDNKGQIKFGEEFIQQLDRFQSDGLDYLYEVEPQSQNLFWVGYFRQAGIGERNRGEIKAFYNAAYRIRKITIPLPKLEIDQQNELRAPIFKNVNFPQEISIEWFEDVYHSVKKYHLDWYARWYNRQFDVLRCGVNGKFRQLTLVAYHYINNDHDSLIETPITQPIMAIKVGGLIPLSLPDITFDHGADQNDQAIAMTYKCSAIHWAYSDKIGFGTDSGQLFADGTGSLPDRDIDIWKPEGFQEEGSVDRSDNSFLEHIRIARAATSHQVAEGAIG